MFGQKVRNYRLLVGYTQDTAAGWLGMSGRRLLSIEWNHIEIAPYEKEGMVKMYEDLIQSLGLSASTSASAVGM